MSFTSFLMLYIKHKDVLQILPVQLHAAIDRQVLPDLILLRWERKLEFLSFVRENENKKLMEKIDHDNIKEAKCRLHVRWKFEQIH